MRLLFLSSLILFISIVGTPGSKGSSDRLQNLQDGRARKLATMAKVFNEKKQLRQTTVPPFYLEEFSNGIPTGWRNIDSANSGRRWRRSNNTCGMCDIIYNGSGVDSLSVQGTSSANGIVMYDSDSSQASIGGDYGVLITPAINCNGRSAVRLTFNELFIYCNDQANAAFQNTGRVYVSNNNVNWTLVHAADAGLANCGDATDNPSQVSVDISGIAANQPTVYVRFTFTGDYSYWWFVDDVALTQPFPYEAELMSIEPITNGCSLSNNEAISITIRNNGFQTMTNFPVSYSINGGTPVIETITNPIPANGTMTYSFNQRADLSLPGSYTIQAAVNLTNDGYTLNDTYSTQAVSSSPSGLLPYFNGMEAAIDYDACIVWDWDGDGGLAERIPSGAHSGNHCLEFPPSASGTTYEKWVFLKCMNMAGGIDYVLHYWTDYSSTSGNGSLRTYLCNGTDPSDTVLAIQNCINAPTTIYTQQSCTFSPPSTGDFHIAFRYAGYNVQSSLRIDDIGLDLTVGISETTEAHDQIIFPNPNNGKFFIPPGIDKSPYSFMITDALGKMVFNKSCLGNDTEQIDLSEIADGIYFMRIQSKEVSQVQRISIRKR
ncbi:MAG: T9SS type A sorting domain-containing protein [Bacteroidota bacterium]